MPGIGEYSALLIIGEIGNIKRFKTAKELVSYAVLGFISQETPRERKEIKR